MDHGCTRRLIVYYEKRITPFCLIYVTRYLVLNIKTNTTENSEIGVERERERHTPLSTNFHII